MQPYKKRNRSDNGGVNKVSKMEETELVLKLNRDEILSKYVVAPHAEVNQVIYDAVNQFVGKYSGDKLLISIMSDDVPEPVQNIFKEVYYLHYEDEYQKITNYLKKRYLRAAMLLVISIVSFSLGGITLEVIPSYIISMFGEISIFCLWEVGYTHFDRENSKGERKRIMRARDAEIEFHCKK